MGALVPPHDVAARKHHCPRCMEGCDYLDPCAECAMGRWRLHMFCRDKPVPAQLPWGVGTCLERKLKRLGFKHTPTCGCLDMAVKMNQWGPDGCSERIDEILAHMRVSAADPTVNPRGWPFVEMMARTMVYLCICECRKKI